VGKSHTLVAFGALAASSELRSTISDAHVAASARRIADRRCKVLRVERGTRATLVEEVAAAFTEMFGGDEAQWGSQLPQMLAIAASRLGDVTLVLIIDTAYGRNARVARNDGPLLSELAQTAGQLNVFVALALDDDISGADKGNVALTGTFQIDYLDEEHLYRVADLFLLRKTPQARNALHDIYLSLRAAVPGFNWSEPRFAAVYPVHPLVADTTAAVRLYVPAFAFLPFAAAASMRAVGRPALSLVLLDEVFDTAESDLRKDPNLKSAFAAYDELTIKGAAQLPVMQRLEAKLVLKALFILSLDGRGASGRELCAALLLSDEADPNLIVQRIEGMLTLLTQSAPPGALQKSQDSTEARFRLPVSSSAQFDSALARSAERLPDADSATNDLLRTIARGRFNDWSLVDEGDAKQIAADLYIPWRGQKRRGRLLWHPVDTQLAPVSDPLHNPPHDPPHGDYQTDCQITVLAPKGVGNGAATEAVENRQASPLNLPQASLMLGGAQPNEPISIVWQPAALTVEETGDLRRLVALRTDQSLWAEFDETARAAIAKLAAQAERIWTRIYVDDGVLITGATRWAWTDEARRAVTLSDALAVICAELFEQRYPQHPLFKRTLSEPEVASLVNGFFGGAQTTEASVQELAEGFAAPLGLAKLRGDAWTPETGDEVLERPWAREVLALTDAASGDVVPLDQIYRALGQAPYGLLSEAQRLVLAALVAQRRIELVTSTGDHISRPALDRSVRWKDVTGVCRAAAILHNHEELTAWARLLTGRATLVPVADSAARETVREALAEWLEAWRERAVLRRFDQMPDEALTTRVWNLAARVRRQFGATADAVEAALIETIPLEEGLQRVADAFLDSPEAFMHGTQQLAELTHFISGLDERQRARAYLASAEPTIVEQIESARRELLQITDDPHSLFDVEQCRRFDLLWGEFKTRYVEHYAELHDRAVNSESYTDALSALLASDGWQEFEALSGLTILNRQAWMRAEELLKRASLTNCDLPVRQLLAERPQCFCSFRLTRADQSVRTAQKLEETMELGRTAYRRTLAVLGKDLAHALDALAREPSAANVSDRARALAATWMEAGT
ncbi:MAG: hypothetical protein H0T92_09120, partial [Pyrinomonadaceae bacterium]|nr:hypothetical protein [Pyrinomonadaceae bacterium]